MPESYKQGFNVWRPHAAADPPELGGRGSIQPQVFLSISIDEGDLLVFVSDGYKENKHQRCKITLPELSVLFGHNIESPDLRGRQTPNAQTQAQIFDRLFPTAVGSLLRKLPPGPLLLKVPQELDWVPWESLLDGEKALGEKFGVTRSLAPADEDSGDSNRVDRSGARPTVCLDIPALSSSFPKLMSLAAAQSIEIISVDAEPLNDGERQRLISEVDVFVFLSTDPKPVDWPEQIAATAPAGTVIVRFAENDYNDEALKRLCFASGSISLIVSKVAEADSRDAILHSIVSSLVQGLKIEETARRARTTELRIDAPADSVRLYGNSSGQGLSTRFSTKEGEHSLRQMTMLSLDLVGSTSLLLHMGGERYSETLQGFHKRCADIIRSFGGVSDVPQGDDGIMCYFGFPVAREAAASSAVRAALDIVGSVAELDLSVRIGIASGRVTVGYGQPVGVPIHLAARLRELAQPGMILASESTQLLLRQQFKLVKFADPYQLKGIEGEHQVFQVVHPQDDERGAPQNTLASKTPLVGRQQEMQRLMQLQHQAQSGVPKVVVLTGEAGVGKTRLLREFGSRLSDGGNLPLVCRCQPEGINTPFQSLSDALRGLLDLEILDTPEVQMAKLKSGLPANLLAREPDADSLIASLVGIAPAQGADRPAEAPERRRERILTLLIDWFEISARQTRLCLIVDDLQWADPSTLEFLNRLVTAKPDLPVLILLVVRTQADTGWRPKFATESIVLQGLSDRDSWLLVRAACGEVPIPAVVIRELASRGDGIPLFLEESAQMAIDLEAEGINLSKQLQEKVPDTLQDLLMARIDRLGDSKVVAQLAAVIGRKFSVTLLADIVLAEQPQATHEWLMHKLHELSQAGILSQSSDKSRPRYQFRHALIRDVAYQSLWNLDRNRIHRRIVEVLTTRYRKYSDSYPELLAWHLSEAGDLAPSIAQWELAARRAASLSANHECIRHLGHALTLLTLTPISDEQRKTELRLQLLLASRYIANEGYGSELVERAYLRSAELCRLLNDDNALLKIELGLEGCYFMRADFERAHDLARRVLERVKASAAPMPRIQANWAVANILWHQGNAGEAVRIMDACLSEYRPEFHRSSSVQDPAIMCLCYSSWAQWDLGKTDDAIKRIHAALDLARGTGHKFSIGVAYGFAASIYHFCGRTDQAWEHSQQALAICEENGFLIWLAHAQMMHGRLLVERGDAQAGFDVMRGAYASWVQSGAVVTRPLYLAMQAEALIKLERYTDARSFLDEALEVAHQTKEHYHEAEILRLLGELTLIEAQTPGEASLDLAEDYFLRAQTVARSQQKRAIELRVATELARLACLRGRKTEAIAMLQLALAQMPASESSLESTIDHQRAITLLELLQRVESQIAIVEQESGELPNRGETI